MPDAVVTRRPSLLSGSRRLAVLILVPLASIACQADAAGGQGSTDGLLVLTGSDTPALEVLIRDGDEPIALDVPLPPGKIDRVSAGGGNILAATTVAGQRFLSDPLDPGGSAAELAGLDWQRVDKTDTGPTIEGPVWFATWDPAGRSYALLAGDLLDGGDMRLVVIDTARPTPLEVALGRPLLAVAPSWLDSGHIALVGGTADAPESLIVEVATGEIVAGPAGDLRIATSGDGKVVATIAGAGAPIVIRSTRAWLAEDGTSIGTITPPDGAADERSMALDAEGDRLAIVWRMVDGPSRYDVHDGTDGWRRVSEATIPGSLSASVSWLR